jgi:hypothetical protein
MQTQKRTPSPSTPVSKKAAAAQTRRQDVRTAPVVLDTQALRHVSGGTTEGPKKYW